MNSPKDNPHKYTFIKLVLLQTGFLFIVFSSLILAYPEDAHYHLGMDQETLNILAYALMMVGVSDLIISLFIFRKKERK